MICDWFSCLSCYFFKSPQSTQVPSINQLIAPIPSTQSIETFVGLREVLPFRGTFPIGNLIPRTRLGFFQRHTFPKTMESFLINPYHTDADILWGRRKNRNYSYFIMFYTIFLNIDYTLYVSLFKFDIYYNIIKLYYMCYSYK